MTMTTTTTTLTTGSKGEAEAEEMFHFLSLFLYSFQKETFFHWSVYTYIKNALLPDSWGKYERDEKREWRRQIRSEWESRRQRPRQIESKSESESLRVWECECISFLRQWISDDWMNFFRSNSLQRRRQRKTRKKIGRRQGILQRRRETRDTPEKKRDKEYSWDWNNLLLSQKDGGADSLFFHFLLLSFLSVFLSFFPTLRFLSFFLSFCLLPTWSVCDLWNVFFSGLSSSVVFWPFLSRQLFSYR